MNSVFNFNYPQIARESGFKLRQIRHGSMDWRLIGSVEVDQVLSEQQFENMDAIVLPLSEAPLFAMLDNHILDSCLKKYFILLQLALQYMIFCRKFLDESVKTLRESNNKLESQNQHLRKLNQENAGHIAQLHKQMSRVEAIHEIVFPCHICTKNFVSNDALNIHLSKKHFQSQSDDNHALEKDQKLINTIKLELEIKQLKERLNNAEKEILKTNQSEVFPSKQIPKYSVSTQIEIYTRTIGTQEDFNENVKGNIFNKLDVGTQCNLFEHKELDCIQNSDVFEVSNLPKKKNAPFSTDLMLSIQEKVSKLEALQETYGSCNQLSIDEIKCKLDDISQFLNKKVKENSEKVSALESIYVSETLALQECKPRTHGSELPIKVNSGKSINKSTELELPIVALTDETYSIHKSSTCSSKKTRSNSSTKDIINEANSKINSLNKIKKTPESSEALNKFRNKMKLVGLNVNIETLSISEAKRIIGYLSEECNTEKVNPKLHAIRNKLNKLVTSISLKNIASWGASKINEKSSIDDIRGDLLTQVENVSFHSISVNKVLNSIIQKPKRKGYISYSSMDTPIKRVMFHTSNGTNNGTSNSIKQRLA